jgi:hypothetical protein
VVVCLQAIAARCEPIATGTWERKPQRTAGRLANFLSQQAAIFSPLALEKVSPRNYRKNQNAKEQIKNKLPHNAARSARSKGEKKIACGSFCFELVTKESEDSELKQTAYDSFK